MALPTAVTEPQITDEEADQVADSFARPAVSAPVKVKAGAAGTFTISPAMIARALTFAARERHAGAGSGRREAAVQRRRRRSRTVELTEPKDATVRLVNGKPKVIAAVNGTEVAAEELKKAVEPALTESGPRSYGQRRAVRGQGRVLHRGREEARRQAGDR